ncbi:Helix-turn-helix transcriptional regulator [Nostoc sp. DSM 114161]|uniref:helix-turn-helix domain-containing protein n=1 Tax=Nostoc sp. DSM 114161 TaxID=3440143 RepID=UPI0040466287
MATTLSYTFCYRWVTFTLSEAFDTIKGMGKAGKALKQVLETYSISQNKLAVTMGTGRPNIHRWVNEIRDPVADTLLEIRDALKKINPAAAEDFIRLYLGDANDDNEQP